MSSTSDNTRSNPSPNNNASINSKSIATTAKEHKRDTSMNIIARSGTEIKEPSKEPTTPSLLKTEVFSSPAPLQIPETPERVRGHINDVEGTPLISPPRAGDLTFTPHKDRTKQFPGTDFYTLLKSPEARLEDKKLKRTSTDLFSRSNEDQSPERKEGDYDSEHLLKSPRRDYKEIRKLSENLRTRLNYANVKVQHGWSNKSIGELELPWKKSPLILSGNSNLEDFWKLRSDRLPKSEDFNDRKLEMSQALLSSPGQFSHNRRRSSFNTSMRLDDIARRGVKSPDLKHTSPLKNGKFKLTINSDCINSGEDLEKDAIFSLISLASPKRTSAPMLPSVSSSSSNGGLPLLSNIANSQTQRLPPISSMLPMQESSVSRRGSINSAGNPRNSFGAQLFGTTPGLGVGFKASLRSDDETDDETTEEETLEEQQNETLEEENVFLERSNSGSRQKSQSTSSLDHKFRPARYDQGTRKVTTKKAEEYN
ncbi:hypothetical protein CAS74_000244 [Pichia kudriavzevii]|uniref:Uncharacterized protein n=1 Tax=Pichia kudriavzevii TaxID=4909 RepID=A0A1Z8JTI4_PICKU|nr:hypothetical protein CAS74_000244 [Pichia kudriavzevii]